MILVKARVPSSSALVRACTAVFFTLLLSTHCSAAQPDDDPRLSAARKASSAEAISLYKDLAHDYPASGTVWYELGTVLSDESQWQDSIDAFRHALAVNTKPALAHAKIGKAQAKLKRYSDAEASYRNSLQLEPENVSTQFGLAAALFNQNKNADAQVLFEKIALRLDEWGAAANEYLVQIYYDQQRYADAVRIAEELVKTAPDNSSARWVLARSLFKLHEYDRALKEFRAISETDPVRKQGALYYVAASLEGLGRTREAEDAYCQVDRNDPTWSSAARDARAALIGKGYFFTLDNSTGYETGIVTNDNIAPVQSKDGYNEFFASGIARVYREQNLSVWMGADLYSLNYFRLHQNDYSQATGKTELRLKQVGLFSDLMLRYRISYAEFDSQPYLLENALEAIGVWTKGIDRVRVGLFGMHTHFFRDFDPLSGPTTGGFGEWRRRLPLWDHELTLRAAAEFRFSESDPLRRLSDRVSLQYRAQIWSVVYGQARMQYRRDDYLSSQITSSHRVDHRLNGEASFDAQVLKRLSINWNYLYESQDSNLQSQEYGRHQISAGFTLRF